MNLKKFMSGLLVVGISVLPAVSYAYSSGNFAYDFKYKLTSRDWAFDDNMKHLKMETKTTANGGAKSFKVELYRVVNGKANFISERTVNTTLNTTQRFGWTGVNKGTYRFVMKKADDGKHIVGSGKIYKSND